MEHNEWVRLATTIHALDPVTVDKLNSNHTLVFGICENSNKVD